MVLAQGALGYGLTSIMGAVVLEIFQGKHYGSIFGTIMLAALAGGAAGPWVTGLLHDLHGNYTSTCSAFAIGVSGTVVGAGQSAADRRRAIAVAVAGVAIRIRPVAVKSPPGRPQVPAPGRQPGTPKGVP